MKHSTIQFIFQSLNNAALHCEAEGNFDGAGKIKGYLDDFIHSTGEVFVLTVTARMKVEQKLREYFSLPAGLPQAEFLANQRENIKSTDTEKSLVGKIIVSILSPIE